MSKEHKGEKMKPQPETKGGGGYSKEGQPPLQLASEDGKLNPAYAAALKQLYHDAGQGLSNTDQDARPLTGGAYAKAYSPGEGTAGIDYLAGGRSQVKGSDLYRGASQAADSDNYALLINIVGNEETGYKADILVSEEALKGEHGKAFADYLMNGGAAELVDALMPYAKAAAGKTPAASRNYSKKQSSAKAA